MASPKDGKAGSLVAPAPAKEAAEASNADPGAVETQSGQGQSESGSGSGSSGGGASAASGASGGSAGSSSGSSAASGDSSASSPAPVHKPDSTKSGWVEIAMVDEQGGVVTSLPYSITLPDGSVATGTLDAQGSARVDGFDPGSCQITFPGLDQEAWQAS